MSDSAVQGKTVSSETYIIQNLATQRYLCLDDEYNVVSIASKYHANAKWNVVQLDNGSYTFQSHRKHWYLTHSGWPENESEVASSNAGGDVSARWLVREPFVPGKYIILPKLDNGRRSDELCWSFHKDGTEDARLLLMKESKNRPPRYAEWQFFLAPDARTEPKPEPKSKPDRKAEAIPVLDPSPQGELDSGKWSGASKLVFSVDIGTMQSAISFVYLENGKAPEIKHVLGWPGEPLSRAKTLSAMYYDKIGNPCAYGIDTQNASVKERAKVEQWTLVHSFKRYIHRLGVSAEISDDADVQALPNNVTETKLYTDWLKFLFKHAKQVVSRELANFSDSTNTEVVFTVPNGWYTQEQAILSNAAVEARIVRKPSAVKFVPETEAAVHWALEQGDLKPKAGTDFIVCDSGGSTTDIAMYKVISVSPLKLCEKEGNPSRCIEAGSALIDEDFNDMIGDHLNNEGLRDVEILEAKQKIAGQFQLAKNQFDGSNLQSTYSIPLTGAVSGGGEKHIPVSRENMIKWFDDVIDTIIAGIDDVLRNNKPQFLLLRGDFGYSPYFQKRLRAHFKRMKLIPASEQNVKAAAAGALVWFQKRSVVSRAARFAYGVEVNVPYDPTDREHVYRAQGGRLTASGNLKHGWGVLVPYGKVLEDDEECTKDYELILPRADAPMVFEFTVYLTEGAEPKKWLCDRSGNVEDDFREVCTVKADLSGQRNNLRKYGSSGGQYYFPFEIALDFGSTSLEACVLWKEGDKVHRGQGEIIPSDFV